MNECLLIALLCSLLGQAGATPPAPIDPAAIDAAIKQLGDVDFQTRERATEALFKAGPAAKAAAEAAAKSNDPEVALRAKLVLKRLASGIGAETSPAMAALIEEFNEIDANRRFTLIHRLAQPEEFRTMWRVIAKLGDPGQRSALESSLRSRLTTVVSEHYRAGKHDEALQLLLSSAHDPRSEAGLITYLSITGRLEATIERLSEPLAPRPGSSNHRRLVLMHRAGGDLTRARQAAQGLEEKELHLWLAAEAADWPAALEINRSRYAGGEPTIEQLAFTLLLSRYARDEQSLADAREQLLKRAAAKPEESWPAAEALLAAEQLDDGIQLLERSVPAAAFYLHWYRTHYDRAFALAGLAEGGELDKAWFDALPDGNLVRTSLSIKRAHYANDIVGCLQYVGRRDEARRVRDLLAESLAGESPGGDGWTALVAADLRLGLRELALADAARGFVPAKEKRPPGYSHAMNVSIMTRLYGEDAMTAVFPLWRMVLAAADEDPLGALQMLDPLLHRPSAARLSPDERRKRLGELKGSHRQESARSGASDRYRYADQLMAIGRLAAIVGEAELAYRYREEAIRLRGAVRERYDLQLLASEAFADRDWPAAMRLLERLPVSAPRTQTWHDQLALARAMLGQRDEALKQFDEAAGFRVDPATYAAQGAILLKHGRKAEAAERLQIAGRLMLPGDGATINALNALGNALHEQQPAAAVPLWQLNMLGPLRGTGNMKLDTYIKNLCVIHRAQARDAIAQEKCTEALAHGLRELDAMPGNVAVVDQLVPLLDAQGQQPLADELLERSYRTYAGHCRQFPRSTRHRNLLARTAARSGRKLDEALRAIGEALEIHAAIDNPSERAELHATEAEVHLARGQRDAAIAAAEKGLKLEPAHAASAKVLARARSAAP